MHNRSAVFYRNLKEIPPRIVRGEGVYLFDEFGKRYLDGGASAGVVGIGHGRVEVTEALREAGSAVTFIHGGMGFTHTWQEQLAEALVDLAPKNMSSVYFVSGGSEANESAIKIARQYHLERGNAQKYKLIARWQSYHGNTLATLSLSGRTSWRTIYSPYLLPVSHIQPPYDYRPLSEGSSASQMSAEELERTILLEGPETVSAFFAEPVVGSSATGLVPSPDYYRQVREICDKYDILFVADEILCGYGRTGEPFAIQHWGVEPDILTAGKMLGSGYAPLAAMIVSDKVDKVFRSGSGRFVHGFTFNGNAFACCAGLKVFEIMSRENLFSRADPAGAYLRQGLEALRDKHEAIGDIRGRGLLLGVELVADRKTKRPFPKERQFAAKLSEAMRDLGVLIPAGVPLINYGENGDHLQFSPPLTISNTEIDSIVAAFDEALTRMAR